jgi:hypothetical protein
MKSYKIRFYLTTGGALEVVIQAKNDAEARRIVKAQYAGNFREFASSRELK